MKVREVSPTTYIVPLLDGGETEVTHTQVSIVAGYWRDTVRYRPPEDTEAAAQANHWRHVLGAIDDLRASA